MQNNAFTAIYLQNSFADIARVLSEFFRDLDVVPSDVIAGLVLLRKRQQLVRFRTVQQVRYNRAGFFSVKAISVGGFMFQIYAVLTCPKLALMCCPPGNRRPEK